MPLSSREMAELGWCDDCQRKSLCRECGNCDCDGYKCKHQKEQEGETA